MKIRLLLPCLFIITSLALGTATADQLPEPLVFQIQRLVTLLGDAQDREEMDGRMIQKITRAPNDHIVLTIFGVQAFGEKQNTQYFAVFVPEKAEANAQHFKLIDAIRIGGSGSRAVERLVAKVTHDQKTGETAIAIPARENIKGDAANAPSGKITIQLQLKNGRLLEAGKR